MTAPFKPGDRITFEVLVEKKAAASYLIAANGNATWVPSGMLTLALKVTPPPAPNAEFKSAVYCGHANESARGVCDCDSDCACREYMCKPAPKAEREAVPVDARIGDLYEKGDAVLLVTDLNRWSGAYRVDAVTGPGSSGWASRDSHALDGWHLLKRGPEPKREAHVWTKGDVVRWSCDVSAEATLTRPAANRPQGVWHVLFGNSTTESLADLRNAILIRHAPTPEPAPMFPVVRTLDETREAGMKYEAKDMTAGERFYIAHVEGFYGPKRHCWSAVPNDERVKWEAAASHHAAAQPAPAAKGDREVVGYVIREGIEPGEGRYLVDNAQKGKRADWNEARAVAWEFYSRQEAWTRALIAIRKGATCRVVGIRKVKP